VDGREELPGEGDPDGESADEGDRRGAVPVGLSAMSRPVPQPGQKR
jgi:hypothetical protein